MKPEALYIITAAGSSQRMGFDKIIQLVQGKPLLYHTLSRFLQDPQPSVTTLVTISSDFPQALAQELQQSFPTLNLTFVPGASSRQASIYNALEWAFKELQPNDELPVWIHDGARPNLSNSLWQQLWSRSQKERALLPVLKLSDTIKRSQHPGTISATIDRENLYRAQTPQVFHWSLIWEAHQQAKREDFIGTDDSSLIERLGYSVATCQGQESNLKLTQPQDLKLLEFYLEERR